jgi:hypothetical protein
MAYANENRREHKRIPWEDEVLVRRFDEEMGLRTAHARDIGEGGLGFVSGEAYEIGDFLDLLLRIGGVAMVFQGRVTNEHVNRTGEHEMGVNFVRLEPESREALLWALERGLPRN